MTKEITLTVNPDGTTQTDFNGFVGTACLAEAVKLAEALKAYGITVEQTNFIPKPELDIPITTTQDAATRITQEGS